MVLLPVVFLLWQAGHAGWGTIWPLIFRSLTWTLLLNTIELGVIVTVCSAVVGVGSAWLIERTNLPLRRFWRAVVVLPLAIRDFVIGYTWLSLTPAVRGLFGASPVMTLGLYPLVYLPVAAALRRVDTSLHEVARSLGLGGPGGCWRRAAVPALLGAVPSLLFMAVLVGLGVGVPASTLVYWLTQPSDVVGVAPMPLLARPGTRCCTASWPRCWRPSRRSPSRTWRCATPGGCPGCSNGSGISCRACWD